ncbi:CDP-alcohol phosphatidyltransferase family protein [Micromonospora sp. NBC_01699]|uniref:CDP-alcohol phosphatidyltransferase family protein n=1 Tax=Micromonospora sp. NBC_01699 TaxID=2975984 RepID=UPI002E2B9677|nr:CDP-alcohol phosphatidyltransferase family protein [Micromonospora sp. NBC_01699]
MRSTTTSAEPYRPSAADFYRANRGGGLFSEALSQRLGAGLAWLAYRFGLSPSTVTIGNLVLGLSASVTTAALAAPVADGTVPAWAAGLVALIGWQTAYALDCADGQLARVTGRDSPAGARLDVLCDVAAQIGVVTALGATAVAQRPSTPVWLVAAFAGSWMVNLVTSVMQSGPSRASLITSTALPVRLVKLVRDYGALIFVAALVLLLAPAATIWTITALTTLNSTFLLASIAASTRPSPH